MFNADATFNNTGQSRFYIAFNHSNATTLFNGNLTLNANKIASGDDWAYFISEGVTSHFTVNGNFTLNTLGIIATKIRTLGGANTVGTYNGNVIINTVNNHVYTGVTMGENGTSTYNGNITLTNNGGSSYGGIWFNLYANASSTLAAGKTISLGAGGFTSGDLSILRF